MKTNTLSLITSYVVIENANSWLPSTAFTFEFWAMRLANGASLFDAMPYVSAYLDSGNANKLTIKIGKATSLGAVQQITTSYSPALNVWHQYQIKRSSAGAVTVLVDHVVVAGPTATSNPIEGPPSQLTIGSNDMWTGQLKLGDFRIWNYDRTNAELFGNSLHWIDGNDIGLLANWQFADGTGVGGVPTSTIVDASWGPADPVQHDGLLVDPNGDSDFAGNDCPVNIRPIVDVAHPAITARLDYGFLSQVAHLGMMLDNGLFVDGLNADVYDESVFNNEYGDLPGVAPEYEISHVPIANIKVLMGMPFDGIALSDYISITDKTTKEHKITTNYQLKEQQVLRVYFPDGRTVHLRVIAVLALHPLSQMSFNFQCVLV